MTRSAVQIDRSQLLLQAGVVARLDRLPVQFEEARHMQDRGHAAQARNRVGQTARQPRIRRQPRQLLELRAALPTGHPNPRHDQLNPVFKKRQIAHPPFGQIVHRPRALAAAAAPSVNPYQRAQSNDAPARRPALLLKTLGYFVPFPAPQPGNNPIGSHRSPPLLDASQHQDSNGFRPAASQLNPRTSAKSLFFSHHARHRSTHRAGTASTAR